MLNYQFKKKKLNLQDFVQYANYNLKFGLMRGIRSDARENVKERRIGSSIVSLSFPSSLQRK